MRFGKSIGKTDEVGRRRVNEVDATVAICTYNGAERLESVIDSLKVQQTRNRAWEIVVVDNASTDRTSEVCKALALSCPVPFRVVSEEKPGLSHARARAGASARGAILCFLDDDNIAEPDWVENAVAFFESHASAGVIGGKVFPIWQTPPDELVQEICGFCLAVCNHGDKEICRSGIAAGPVGAGLCIRRELLQRIYSEKQVADSIRGHRQNDLGGGEDTAINVLAKQLGYQCWYVPTLRIGHVIPEFRMQLDYLLRLYRGIGAGQAAVRRLYDWKARNPVLATLIAAKDFGRWLHGCVWGPYWKSNGRPSELSWQLHKLRQRQLWGRACQALFR